MNKLSDFLVLTFDCYGTLIDWEAGILAALKPLRDRAARDLSDEDVLQSFSRHENSQEEETPGLLYSKLLETVHAGMAKEWGVEPDEADARRFGESVADWPAFPDSPEALSYLKAHYRLVILSNVDRRSFAGSNRRLGVEFDAIYTAEDIGSYKPDRRNFDYMIARLAEQGVAKGDILHTAQSLYHDHVPASQMGLASAWIDRRAGKLGSGATKLPDPIPSFDFRFESLAEMADAHRRESGG